MNGFIRIGECINLTVLNPKNLLKLSNKDNFCLKETCPFESPSEFQYEPEKYLYFRSRSITADVPNKNGDYFSWDELKKAHKSFIGKGFYLNHDSDSPTKAKGIILDAELNDDAKYIETLVAVDRQIAPEICQLIESGIINSVSMGCMAARAKCSVCDNEAFNMETLCEHMHPKSAQYVKGKLLGDGSRAFESNFDIGFTELSGVSVPADGEAHIFEIFANDKSNKELLDHLSYYLTVKAAKEKKEDKPKEEKPSGRPAVKSPDTLADAIEKAEEQMPKKIIEFFGKYINDSIMKLLKVKLGDEAAVLQSAISDELSKEVDKVAEPIKTELKKFLSGKPEIKPEVGPEIKEEKSEAKPMELKAPEIAPKLPATSGFDLGWFRKQFVEKIDQEFKRQADTEVHEIKPESILNVPGFETVTLVYDDKVGMYNIVEDGKKLPGFIPIKDDDIEDKNIKEKTEPMDLILRIMKGKERSEIVSDIGGVQMDTNKEVKQELEKPAEVPAVPAVAEPKAEEVVAATNKFNIIYVPGFTPASSFFVGREGDSKEKVKTISAALVMPEDVQKVLLEAAISGAEEDPKEVVSPEEVIEQIKTACESNYDKFCTWVEATEKAGLARTAEWAINEAEIMTVPLPKPGEVFKAIKESEAEAGLKLEDHPAEQGSEVKKYYNRLPNSGSGEPDRALNLQSGVNERYNKLVEAYEKEKLDKEAALKELDNLKRSGAEQEKEKVIESILNILQANKKIANEDEKKEVLNQLTSLTKEALVSMVKLLEKTSSSDSNEQKDPMKNMGEILPQTFANFESAKTMVETMSDIWNK